MLMGHYATAVVAYQMTAEKNKKANIWLYLAASQLLDFAMVAFVVLGIESWLPQQIGGSLKEVKVDMTYTHDILPVFGWALAAAALTFLLLKDRYVAMWVGALVLGHEVLDLLVGFEHFIFGTETAAVGLGLYHSAPVSGMLIETALCLGILLWFFQRRSKTERPISMKMRIALLATVVGGSLSMIPIELMG